MEEIYRKLAEDSRFRELSYEDKIKYGDKYAEMLMKSDPRFTTNPEAGEYLRNSLRQEIDKENAPPTFMGRPMEDAKTMDEFFGRLTDAWGSTISDGTRSFTEQNLIPLKDELMRDIRGENPKSLLEQAGDVALHTVGIPGRVANTLTQLPLIAAQYGFDKIGLNDTGLAKWTSEAIVDLQKRNEQMRIFKGVISKMEPDIVLAMGTGAAIGPMVNKLAHSALAQTAVKLGTPGFTATDAAITTGWSAGVGEAVIGSPATQLAEHYIEASGYDENTKSILHATVPIFFGLVSGVTYENYLDQLLKNPAAVRSITKGVKQGRSPKQILSDISGKIKFPKIKEILGDLTDGQPPKYNAAYGADIEGGLLEGQPWSAQMTGFGPQWSGAKAGDKGRWDFDGADEFPIHSLEGQANDWHEMPDWGAIGEPQTVPQLLWRTQNPREILQWMGKNSSNPEYRVIAKALFDAVNDEMTVKGQGLFDNVNEKGFTDLGNAYGVYGRDSNFTFNNEYIALRNLEWDRPGVTESTLMHELVHAGTIRAYHFRRQRLGYGMNSDDPIIAELEAIGAQIKDYVSTKLDNNLHVSDDEMHFYTIDGYDPDELMAYALTDLSMQKILQKHLVTTPGASTTLWDRFSNVVMDLLGLPKNQVTALSRVLDLTNKIIDQNRWELPADQVVKNQSKNSILFRIKEGGKLPSAEKARAYFSNGLHEDVAAGKISQADFWKVNNISNKLLDGWMFNGSESKIGQALDHIGITGKENNSLEDWANASNQDGFATSDFLRHVMVNAAPLMTGFNTDREGNLTWYPEQYLAFGAPWHAIGLGGKAYRAIGANKVIRSVGSKFSQKFWDNITHPLVSWTHSLRPTEGMLPEIYAIKGRFRSGRNKLRRSLDEFAIDLRKHFNQDELRMISDIVEREGNWENYAPRLHKAAQQTRKLLDDIREQLVNSGISHEDINKLGDEYLPRVYMSKIMQSPRYQKAGRSLKRIHAKYLIRRGLNRNVAKIFAQYSIDLEGVEKGFAVYQFTGPKGGKIWVPETEVETLSKTRHLFGDSEMKWTVVEKDKGKVIVNRDYTKGEREAMGESRDVSLRLAAFFREVSHDITMGHIFKNIGANEKLMYPPRAKGVTKAAWAKEARDAGYVLLPDTETTAGVKKFGALAGSYVKEDVAKMLKSLTRQRFENASVESIYNLFRSLMRPWKIGMTAFNVPTHMLNMVTNLHIAVMDGRNPLKLGVDGLYTLVKKDEYFKAAIDAGLIDSGIISAEWNLKSFMDVTKGLKGDVQDVPLIMSALRKAGRFVKGTAAFPMKMYQWEDEVFKLGVFRAEMKNGASAEEALKTANDSFFDYSDVPRGIEAIRDTGIIPFISFSYKILPVVLRTIKDHPERMAGMIYAYYQINNLMYDKQFGETGQAQKELEESLRPEWQQDRFYKGGPSSHLRLQNNPETGEARTLDVSRFMPVADLFTDMTQAFPFGMNPLVSIAYGLFSGKHAAFGKDIAPYENPRTPHEAFENKLAYMTYIARTLTPNNPALPWSYSHDKVGNALVASGAISPEDPYMWKYAQWRGWDGKNFFGNQVNANDTVLSTIGFKINELDVDEAIAQKQTKIKRQYGKDKGNLKYDLRRAGTTREEEEAFKRYDERLEKNNEELDTLTRLLDNAGK